MHNKYLLPAFVLSCCVYAIAGAEPYGPTAEEGKLMPAYCGGPGFESWKAVLGQEMELNNHTCYGIVKIHRYYKNFGSADKKSYLDEALIDFNYSVGHLSPEFKLMPEILYYRGLTRRLQGKDIEAIPDFVKSISLDQKYTKSITELADIYDNKLTDRKKALGLVTEGLRHNPNSKELKRRYGKLGGALPYPEPYEKNGNEQESEKVKDSHNPPIELPGTSGTTAKQNNTISPDKTTGIPSTTDAANPDKPVAIPPQPVIGSKSNPWCRFCPDAGQASDPATSKSQVEPKAVP